jgi:3-oxoacyl-[acyl-carrier-protein] synthase III
MANEMKTSLPRIIGTGWAVPKKIRLNGDPIFDWLKANYPNQELFEGYKVRHVLDEGEDLMTIMVPAAKMALKRAKKKPEDIDLLIGTGSISEYIQPNALSQLHKELGLPARAWVIPVGDDYSNFASSLLLADGLLKANRAKNILICLGGNWTRNVDYHTLQSISAADGAGAAVMAMSTDKSRWYVADQCTVTDTRYYGSMYTDGVALEANPPIKGFSNVFSPHFFQITAEGGEGFKKFGTKIALTSVTKLLKQNKITAANVSFIPHQTSSVLIDYWCTHLSPKPAQVLSTLEEFANVTVAIHALNLAWFEEKGTIEKNKLVLMALGPDMHANAMLLQRG